MTNWQAAMIQNEHLPEGAIYREDFISLTQESDLVAALDGGLWSTELRRRVQHFGYRYDYRARGMVESSFLGLLPEWLSDCRSGLVEHAFFSKAPDQVIANEYQPGQGISAHIDCVPCFGGVIASLSLLSACEMVFRHRMSGARLSVLLAPRSLVVLTGPARYEWTHEIPARLSDVVAGERRLRQRRISLTFRSVTGA